MSVQVTWLLPVKDAMPHLRQTLESIGAQTRRHWQVLAWDNGSTDGSVRELQRWIPHRLPGRVVVDQPMSLGACLARMVQESSTPLCARIDADDVNEPDRLERQVAFLRDHSQVAVVGTGIRFIDEQGNDRDGAWSVYTDDSEIRWRLRFCNALNHPTVLFRRSAVLAAGNYRDMMPGQDYDLWVRVAAGAAMGNLPQPLVRYRLSPSSVGARHPGMSEQLFERVASDHASIMFPGLDREQALRLRRLVTNETQTGVTLTDCLNYRRCAVESARRVGRHSRYFRSTQSYRQQFRSLFVRWLKRQPGAAAAAPVIRSARRRLGSPRETRSVSHGSA